MESPRYLDDDQISIDPSEPFKGIVVCCTSIPPEYRTEIAHKIIELGGVHKYDLTPDVTHLIVGDYDTPKYRHVARERPDIRAMDASWVDAVSQLWKEDEHIDFLKLEREHKLRPLETKGAFPPTNDSETPTRQSLLICLTGFGHQRDGIAEKIVSNGGRHTDDLTRRCTHLVVSKPEGKKFTAAKSWNIRTVTLEWLEQSVLRGMILEEEKFDPLLPPEEQGRGAWIKKDPRRPSLGKRSISTVSAGPDDRTRKLRKTASMKLNSQRNNLWGDILGRSDSREYSLARDSEAEEPSPTVPVKREPGEQERRPPPPPPEKEGIFSDCVFYIHGFNGQRSSVLSQTIEGLDGQIASTLSEAATNVHVTYHFLIVPQSSQPEEHPQVAHDNLHVITEFYIEKCLHNRQFFNPGDQHALGRPFPLFPIPGFDSLTVCSAAFTGVELSQVAKSVRQLGARYEEQFRASTSVLVCRSFEAVRKDKIRYALAWGVPVVSADWLWECISTGYNVPVDEFIFPELRGRLRSRKRPSPSEPSTEKPDQTNPQKGTDPQSTSKSSTAATSRPLAAAGVDTTAFDQEPAPSVPSKPGRKRLPIPQEESTISADFNTARTRPAPATADPPLTELSSASINKSPSPPKTAQPPRTKSEPPRPENGSPQREKQDADPEAEESRRRAAKAAERQALTTKLTSLLDTPTGPASAAPAAPDDGSAGPRPRRRQILGRATSNVSTGSSSASAPAAAAAAQQHGADGPAELPPTQIGYDDPEAQGHKAALMDRMMGGKGDVAKVSPTKTASAPAVPVPSGRSLRRR